MTNTQAGPPIRTMSAARNWLLFEVRELLSAPFEDWKGGMWFASVIVLLLWPVLLILLFGQFLGITACVLLRREKDEAMKQMWDKFADHVTDTVFRIQPDGKERGNGARTT